MTQRSNLSLAELAGKTIKVVVESNCRDEWLLMMTDGTHCQISAFDGGEDESWLETLPHLGLGGFSAKRLEEAFPVDRPDYVHEAIDEKNKYEEKLSKRRVDMQRLEYERLKAIFEPASVGDSKKTPVGS